MKSKLFSVIIMVAVVLICLIALPTEASATTADYYTYYIMDNGTAMITECDKSIRGDVVIPDTLDGHLVTRIASDAFTGCTGLTSIIIPNSVSSIGESAFSGCSSLESITIPFVGGSQKTVTDWNQYPFGYIFGTASYTGGVATTQHYRGTNLYSSTVNSTYYIPASLKSVNVTGGNILYGAFYNCNSITSINLPNSVAKINEYAFYNCSSLLSVNIPNSVTSIGSYAFKDCASLRNIVIPNSVTYISNSVFAGCSNLESITIPFVGSEVRKSSDNYQYPLGWLFGQSSYAGSVETIQQYYEGTNLSPTYGTYYIPASLKSVNVTGGNILYGAFYNCSGLTSIDIPDDITKIGSNAFYNCSNLTSIVVPKSVTNIDSGAFSGCSSLWHVLYTGTEAQWNNITITGNWNFCLTEATRHYECTGNEHLEPERNFCSICSANCSHDWGTGTVTKVATCKEAGSQFFTCSVCNAIKNEEIAKTNDHSYSNWAPLNDDIHKHICSVCQKEETASHAWNTGAVTKQPSCKETGTILYTCTVCGGTKTETLDKLTSHTYDNACDTSCNVCGDTRTVPHQYNEEWVMTKTNHWHECSICGDKKDLNTHTPGAAATESTAQICTVCGYVITPALGHTHNYSSSLSSNRIGHWYACGGCSEQKDYADHIYTNSCDIDCNTCGYIRITTHSFAETWTNDPEKHWHACNVCGAKSNEEAHVPGMQATETTPQTCTACGYMIKAPLGHTHDFSSTWTMDNNGHWHTCAGCEEKGGYAAHTWNGNCCTVCNASDPNATQPAEPSTDPTEPSTEPQETGKQDGKGNTIWIVLLIVGIICVAGGVTAGVLLWKKKKL